MGVSVFGESPWKILFTILPAFLCEINYGFFFHKSCDCLICKENHIGILGVNVAP